MRIHDITLPIDENLPVWPGDPRPVVSGKREEYNIRTSELSLSAHTGTHIDAPSHFVEGGQDVHDIPLETLIGPAMVIDVTREVKSISAELLNAFPIPPGTERLLLKTGNGRLYDRGPEFVEDYVGITPDGARWIRDRGIKLVGIDYLSIGPYDLRGLETHKILLESGIVVLEGLRLEEVQPGRYELVCLPINLMGVDGAPVRAVLFESNPGSLSS